MYPFKIRMLPNQLKTLTHFVKLTIHQHLRNILDLDKRKNERKTSNVIWEQKKPNQTSFSKLVS